MYHKKHKRRKKVVWFFFHLKHYFVTFPNNAFNSYLKLSGQDKANFHAEFYICITHLTVTYRSVGQGLAIICKITICICSTKTYATYIYMIYLLTYLLILPYNYVAKRDTSWRCYYNQLLIGTWFNKLNKTF